MVAIAICLDSTKGLFVGGFRLLDENGIGTEETLTCETPVRNTRKAALRDARATIA